MIEQQACPLCKKKFNQLHSHLRNKHRLSARERRPYMKIARSAVKHKDAVLNKTDIIVTEFEEQKFSLDNDFKDIDRVWHKKAFFRSSQKIHDVVFFNEKLTYCKTNETVFNQYFQKLGIPQGVTKCHQSCKIWTKIQFF